MLYMNSTSSLLPFCSIPFIYCFNFSFSSWSINLIDSYLSLNAVVVDPSLLKSVITWKINWILTKKLSLSMNYSVYIMIFRFLIRRDILWLSFFPISWMIYPILWILAGSLNCIHFFWIILLLNYMILCNFSLTLEWNSKFLVTS